MSPPYYQPRKAGQGSPRTDGATPKQRALLKSLCAEQDVTFPKGFLTVSKASELIDELVKDAKAARSREKRYNAAPTIKTPKRVRLYR